MQSIQSDSLTSFESCMASIPHCITGSEATKDSFTTAHDTTSIPRLSAAGSEAMKDSFTTAADTPLSSTPASLRSVSPPVAMRYEMFRKMLTDSEYDSHDPSSDTESAG